jgi:hypothetical protein
VTADWAWPLGRPGAEPRRRRAGAAEAGGTQRRRAGAVADRGRWPHLGQPAPRHAIGAKAGRWAERQAEAHRTGGAEGRGRRQLAGP